MIAWAPLFHYSLTEAGNGVILLLLFLDIDIGSTYIELAVVHTENITQKHTEKSAKIRESPTRRTCQRLVDDSCLFFSLLYAGFISLMLFLFPLMLLCDLCC